MTTQDPLSAFYHDIPIIAQWSYSLPLGGFHTDLGHNDWYIAKK